MATIIIPTPLRKFTDNKAKITTDGGSNRRINRTIRNTSP